MWVRKNTQRKLFHIRIIWGARFFCAFCVYSQMYILFERFELFEREAFFSRLCFLLTHTHTNTHAIPYAWNWIHMSYKSHTKGTKNKLETKEKGNRKHKKRRTKSFLVESLKYVSILIFTSHRFEFDDFLRCEWNLWTMNAHWCSVPNTKEYKIQKKINS